MTPAPSATPLPGPSALPSPTPLPSATPLPSPTPAPSATPPSPYLYIVEPPPEPAAAPDGPKIVRIELNDRTLRPGGLLAVRVTTTPNVNRIVASTSGYSIDIVKAADGLFAGMTNLPSGVPLWFLRTYQVTFTAFAQDGRRATATIPVTLGR